MLTVFILAFPIVHNNDADIDSMANAAAYATLALGLNIVVGFAGLLDLGYAAFFAIGAYFYGVFTSFQVMPLWSGFWQPLAALGLVEKLNQGGPDLVHFTLSFWLALPLGRRWSPPSSACCSASPRCGCAATISPSSRSASAKSCRSSRATSTGRPTARPA